MGATSVTGSGPGIGEGPAHLDYNLDNIRKVYVNDNGNFLPCIEIVGNKYVLRQQSGLSSSGPIIISGSSVQCNDTGDPRGFKAYDFQCCRTLDSQVASGDYSFIAAGCANTTSGKWSHAEGENNTASGSASHAEGAFTTASGFGAHAEGGGMAIASGPGSHAEGAATLASGFFAHAEGDTTQATGTDSHAEGAFTLASGSVGHAEGVFTTASGTEGHAEGAFTLASGAISHAEGNNTTATGYFSHAEGWNTISSHTASHAEGHLTVASNPYAHAEGNYTTASNKAAHAEGSLTEAIGIYSHAEGFATNANGGRAHAEGDHTTAGNSYSHAGGQYSTTRMDGMFVRANGKFFELGDAQHTMTVFRRETNSVTPAELTTNGLAPHGLNTNRFRVGFASTYNVWIKIAARDAGAGGDSAIFTRYLEVSNVTGTTAIVGAVETIGTDKGTNAGVPPVGWTVAVTADDPNDCMVITVTGTATSIRWVALVETVEVIYQ